MYYHLNEPERLLLITALQRELSERKELSVKYGIYPGYLNIDMLESIIEKLSIH